MEGETKHCVPSASGCGHLVGQQLGLPGSCEDVCPGKAQPVIAQRLDQLRNVEQDIILEGEREWGGGGGGKRETGVSIARLAVKQGMGKLIGKTGGQRF